jgi:endoglucanase
MKKYFYISASVLLFFANFSRAWDETIVEKWGQLRVKGTHIVNEAGEPVALRGISLFWSQWIGKYYNYDCIEWLKDDWQCTVVRAAMAVEGGGYLINPETEMAKIEAVIEACIDMGIYVVVDWHDHNAQAHIEEAIDFFTQIAQYYGDSPNLIYEIYNEPLQVSWSNVIKPYADTLIHEIRLLDPDNIIVVGTPTWSQDVDAASKNPVTGDHIAYALHFYSGTHTQWLRNKAVTAMKNGAALFVTEFGVCESDGSGDIYYDETEKWFTFMNDSMLSWCNWSVADKDETSAALRPGASATGGWSDTDLTESGAYIREAIIAWNEPILSSIDKRTIAAAGIRTPRNRPNPFNGNTLIEFDLPVSQRVTIELFNISGQKMITLFDAALSSGSHRVPVNLTTFPSGIYMYRYAAGHAVQTGKLNLVK